MPDRHRERPLPALRTALAGALCFSCLTCLAGCVSPAYGSRDYRAKAYATVQAATGVLATAQLATDVGLHGRAWREYLDAVLTSADRDLSAIIQTFDSVQPPAPADDRLRANLDNALTDAQDVVSGLRIAVRRSGGPGLAPLAPRLQAASKELAQISSAIEQAT